MSSVIKVDAIQNQSGTRAMTIDNGGIVATPAQPRWLLLGIPNNITSQSTVIWGQSSFSPGTQSQTNGCTYDSSTGYLSISKTGLYQMDINFIWRTSASNEVGIALEGSTDNFSSSYAHGSSAASGGYIILQEFHDHGTEWFTTHWGGMLNLTAGEKLRVRQTTSHSITVPNNDANGGHWTGFFVG